MVTAEAAERFLGSTCLPGADAATRRELINVLDERRVAAGTLLLEQGRPNDRIWFLLEGSVSVYRMVIDGHVEAVANLTGPSVFGETSFFRTVAPSVSVKAQTDLWLLTLDHDAHAVLRRADPNAAEQLALSAVRVLAERFDLLDRRVSEFLARHPDEPARTDEWSSFRARLFREASL
ncbi:MAG: cyclic nucleotide-binding domain-containing protein [Isosphaeraceae bacterium]